MEFGKSEKYEFGGWRSKFGEKIKESYKLLVVSYKLPFIRIEERREKRLMIVVCVDFEISRNHDHPLFFGLIYTGLLANSPVFSGSCLCLKKMLNRIRITKAYRAKAVQMPCQSNCPWALVK